MPFLSDIRAMILAALLAVCAIIGAIQTVRLNGFLWIDGALDRAENLERDNNELRAELKAISTKRNEQRETTEDNIRQSQKYIQIRDKEAERIEKAPLPGGCQTPKEILDYDL